MSLTTTKEYRLPEFTGIQALKLQESKIPEVRGSDVLVKVHAVSLQFRDLAIASGKYSLGVKENPVPCSDAAGEIIEVGADVKGWKKGDRVCANFTVDHIAGDITAEMRQTALGGSIDGVLTQYKVLPAHCLVRIPEHLSYEEASTLPCAALTAYNALHGPTPVKAGDTVLVLGTGGVSIFGLQVAIASGAEVIATSSSDEKLEKVKQLGAKHVINYNKNTDWDQEVLKLTSGRGVDHVIEVGGPGTLPKSLRAVKLAGWVHTIGFLASDTGENFNVAMQCVGKAAIIRGILIGSRHQFEDMNRLITTAQLRPVIDKVFSFEDAPMAYEYLQSQKHLGKVVIKVVA